MADRYDPYTDRFVNSKPIRVTFTNKTEMRNLPHGTIVLDNGTAFLPKEQKVGHFAFK